MRALWLTIGYFRRYSTIFGLPLPANRWAAIAPGPSSKALSFSHALVPVFHQRREKITQQTARASFDFDRHGHPGSHIDQSVVNLRLRTISRHAHGTTHVLSFEFARR